MEKENDTGAVALLSEEARQGRQWILNTFALIAGVKYSWDIFSIKKSVEKKPLYFLFNFSLKYLFHFAAAGDCCIWRRGLCGGV